MYIQHLSSHQMLISTEEGFCFSTACFRRVEVCHSNPHHAPMRILSRHLSRIHLPLPMSKTQQTQLGILLKKSFSDNLEKAHEASPVSEHYGQILARLSATKPDGRSFFREQLERIKNSSDVNAVLHDLGAKRLLTPDLVFAFLRHRRINVKDTIRLAEDSNIPSQYISSAVVLFFLRKEEPDSAREWVLANENCWLQRKGPWQLEALLKYRARERGIEHAWHHLQDLMEISTPDRHRRLKLAFMEEARRTRDNSALERVQEMESTLLTSLGKEDVRLVSSERIREDSTNLSSPLHNDPNCSSLRLLWHASFLKTLVQLMRERPRARLGEYSAVGA